MRFLSDSSGCYDLSAVSAVTKGGSHNAGTSHSPKMTTLAILLFSGGSILTTSSYDDVQKSWVDFHSTPETIPADEMAVTDSVDVS